MIATRLTPEQRKVYDEQGFLTGLPVFDEDQVKKLNAGLQELAKLLKPGEDYYQIKHWHHSSKWLYDLCTTPQILDYVEDILGPDFYLWGTHFFSKAPHSTETVAWHQDAPYWALSPHESVTVWLAFTDVDEENGAMQVIPGTHKSGLIELTRSKDNTNVLELEMAEKAFGESDAVTLCMKAGQISLHDDALVHGSKANTSDRWRIGLTMRYSSTRVKADRNIWKGFQVHVVRGKDDFHHNIHAAVPTETFGSYDWRQNIEGRY